MKKATALMLVLLMMATFLTGCAATPPEPELPAEEPEQIQPEEQPVKPVANDPVVPVQPADRPNLTLQTACYWNDFLVEIPLVVGVDTETTRQMNAEFAALAQEFAAWDVTDPQRVDWIEWNSRLYANEGYLQVVMTQIGLPTYGREVDRVKTWSYDVANDRMVTLEEALQGVNLTRERLEELFDQRAAEAQDQRLKNVTGLELAGFRILSEYTTDFYWLVTSQPEGADGWTYFYSMRCGKDGYCTLNHCTEDYDLRR